MRDFFDCDVDLPDQGSTYLWRLPAAKHGVALIERPLIDRRQNADQAVEKRIPDRSLEPEQSLPGGRDLVAETGNVDRPSAQDGLREISNAEERPQLFEPHQPQLGAAQAPSPLDQLDQPSGTQRDGTLALEQLEALSPRLLRALAQPQQVALMTETGSNEVQVSDPSLVREYLDNINERVQRSKVDPRTLSTGTVVLKYTVGTDGSLISMIVLSGSGSTVLDAAAISAIHKAAPFPTIPSAVSAKPMTFLQPFKFVIR